MKIAVFGGAGVAGDAVMALAVQQGWTVRALVRGAADRVSRTDHVEVVRGDAFDPDAVDRTVAGAEAVISTLGGYRGPESIATGTANIVTSMRRHAVNRLVVLQGFHIEFPGDPRNPGRAVVKMFLSVRCAPLIPNGAALGRLLRATDDLDWTLVRIPRMVEGPPSGRAQLGRFALGPIVSVNVGDVAATLLDLAGRAEYVRDAPMLVTPPAGRPLTASRPASPASAGLRESG
jgi:putative NADH-flavin reductase